MEKEVYLFGQEWKNSKGGTDYWYFELRGEKVIWSFHALFDAKEWEEDDGYAEFGKYEFKKLLEDWWEKGGAVLRKKNADGREACVKLKKMAHSMTEVEVRPDSGTGISKYFIWINPSIIDLLE